MCSSDLAVDEDISGRKLVAVVDKLTKGGYAVGGDAVRTRPRGVPVDHPRLDLIRHESLTVSRRLEPAECLSANFAKTLSGHWKAVAPLVEWCRDYAPPS